MSSSQISTPRSPPSGSETLVFNNTFIQRSRPYLTEAQIDFLRAGSSEQEAKDVQTRLNACAWIMQVGNLLQFPVRTMATAMILYHRFLLFNRMPWLEHSWADAAAAALFVACKIEDTLKKSREILAVGYNIRHPQAEPLNPDSNILDEPSKRVIGIERMILETSSFDFRYRHAQPFLIKFARLFECERTLTLRAWRISVDVYRTLAPLRATPHALALASLDLAARLEDLDLYIRYDEFETDRETVLSVMDDLLDLYTNHASQTILGPLYSNTTFLNQRISLNRERKRLLNGHHHHPENGTHEKPVVPRAANLTDRGTSGCVRFMIDPERETRESELLSGVAQGVYVVSGDLAAVHVVGGGGR